MNPLVALLTLSLFGSLAFADGSELSQVERVLHCETGTTAVQDISLHDPLSLKRLKAKPGNEHLADVKFNCGEYGLLVLTSAARAEGKILGCTSGDQNPNGIPLQSGLNFPEACVTIGTYVDVFDVTKIGFEKENK